MTPLVTAHADHLEQIGRRPDLPLVYAATLLVVLVVAFLVARSLLLGPLRR